MELKFGINETVRVLSIEVFKQSKPPTNFTWIKKQGGLARASPETAGEALADSASCFGSWI